jgi:hypothetical protein
MSEGNSNVKKYNIGNSVKLCLKRTNLNRIIFLGRNEIGPENMLLGRPLSSGESRLMSSTKC